MQPADVTQVGSRRQSEQVLPLHHDIFHDIATLQQDGVHFAPRRLLVGAPGEIRTPDRLVRSQVLYPAELRAHHLGCRACQASCRRQVNGELFRELRFASIAASQFPGQRFRIAPICTTCNSTVRALAAPASSATTQNYALPSCAPAQHAVGHGVLGKLVGGICSAHPWASPLRFAPGPACGGPISFRTKLSNPRVLIHFHSPDTQTPP